MSELVMSNQAEKSMNNEQNLTKSLGFWIYLMTDCVLFASLFATYVILRGSTYGGPSGHDVFNMPAVFVETILLLTSSFTCGLAVVMAKINYKQAALVFLTLTFVFGAGFLTMELSEFSNLVAAGHSWQASAFLSAFFTLVGTHGLHISVGLLWIAVMIFQVMKRGFTDGVLRRLTLFALFWHFLDIIWIFIFTIVYLMGVA
ncbi:MAG TPA: cytochrome o ubiquinol oxidase subunit III [Candidatus Chromulinivoraceae bacterium]|nr:cytochrome o ubiquinol oxidase subunit III [Candidatus Chromulinivoraceae bacterium]